MRSERDYTKPDGRQFYVIPWRYCSPCGMCHNERKKYCLVDADDWKRKGIGNSAGHAEHFSRHDEERSYDSDERRKMESRYMRDVWGDSEDGWDSRHVDEERPRARPEPERSPCHQAHVHEYEGSTKLSEFEDDIHNHRIAGISGEAVRITGSHIHMIWTRTDFFDHFHYIQQYSGPAIYADKADGGKAHFDDPHVHFVTGQTTDNHGHEHEFQLAMLIESPLLPQPEQDEHGAV